MYLCDIIFNITETDLPGIYTSFQEVLVLQFYYNMHAKMRKMAFNIQAIPFKICFSCIISNITLHNFKLL